MVVAAAKDGCDCIIRGARDRSSTMSKWSRAGECVATDRALPGTATSIIACQLRRRRRRSCAQGVVNDNYLLCVGHFANIVVVSTARLKAPHRCLCVECHAIAGGGHAARQLHAGVAQRRHTDALPRRARHASRQCAHPNQHACRRPTRGLCGRDLLRSAEDLCAAQAGAGRAARVTVVAVAVRSAFMYEYV